MAELDQLYEQLSEQARASRRPLAQWTPEFTGDMAMEITVDGRWLHEGSEIRREALVKLFASILRCEDDGQHYLVTPVEKYRIQVADAPFLAIDAEFEDGRLFLKTNLDEWFSVDAEANFELRSGLAYAHFRDGLWAKIHRNVYYRLVELASLDEDKMPPELYLDSSGVRLCLGELET